MKIKNLPYHHHMINYSTRQHNLYKRFREYNPNVFKRGAYPKTAEDWLRHINRIFKVMRCIDEETILLGSFSLREAQLWWEAMERRFWARRQQMTWDLFKKELSKQYISKSARD